MIKPQLLYEAVKEIETNSGQWYQVMTMPYIRQSDNKQSGAIITFNFIIKLKKHSTSLMKRIKACNVSMMTLIILYMLRHTIFYRHWLI